MQETMHMAFRDPREKLKLIILDHGFDHQQDQPLLDRVSQYSFEFAVEVLRIIEIRLEEIHYIPQDELSDFILSSDNSETIDSNAISLH